MARKSGKTRSPVVQQLYKQRNRINRALRRMEKQGYMFPDFFLPPIPKRITKASVSRLEKITPKYLREKYGYKYEDINGEIVISNAQEAFNRQRIKIKPKQISVTPIKPKHEYAPKQSNITVYNFVTSTASHWLSKDELDMILSLIENADKADKFWQPLQAGESGIGRSRNPRVRAEAITKSLDAQSTLYSLLTSKLRDYDNLDEFGMRISEAASYDSIMTDLEKAMFGYDEEMVQEGFNAVVRILQGGAMSASQAKMYDGYDADSE